jgi:isopenicillin-N epimerase
VVKHIGGYNKMMENLKSLFLLDPDIIYLNHGSFGATPKEVFSVYQEWQRELEKQPVEFLSRRYRKLMADAREKLGTYLGTNQDNLVFTTNVTESINIVARSLPLGPGDEVLGTNHEYGAIERIWHFMAKERGFRYVSQNIPFSYTTNDEFIEHFWRGVSKNTKAISISHITSPTSLTFPIREIINKVRENGIISIIDGAHAPGQVKVDLEELGPDFYGGNLHKWMCAPKGAGFLFANPAIQERAKPLIVSWGYEAEIPGKSKFIDEHEWTGTRDISSFLAVPAAIEFFERHQWEDVQRKCQALVKQAREEIAVLFGDTPKGKSGDHLQMASIKLPASINNEKLQVNLYEQYRIEIPVFTWSDCNIIRVSIQGYNTQEEVDKLISALGYLVSRN